MYSASASEPCLTVNVIHSRLEKEAAMTECCLVDGCDPEQRAGAKVHANDHTLQSSRPILDDLVGLSIGDHRRCPCCVGPGSAIIGLNIQTAYLPAAEGPLIVVAKGCTNLKLSGSQWRSIVK